VTPLPHWDPKLSQKYADTVKPIVHPFFVIENGARCVLIIKITFFNFNFISVIFYNYNHTVRSHPTDRPTFLKSILSSTLVGRSMVCTLDSLVEFSVDTVLG